MTSLAWMIAVPLIGAPLAWQAENHRPNAGRWVSLAIVAVMGLVLAVLMSQFFSADGLWLLEWEAPWIPRLGISAHLALDGLSLLMVVLTLVLGLVAILASWDDVTDKVGFYHANLLLTLAGILGVFMALDLFLFFFFWEVMLVPMYFIISIWGHENRNYSAIKFFIFTQASGLLMLAAILGLVWSYYQTSGVITFSYMDHMNAPLSPDNAFWLMLGFFLAFAVKLPIVPFHTWLPDAHTDAPTGGSVLLAGVLLKTGGYGLLRFVLPLFPEAAVGFAPVAMMIGALGVLYGAIQAFAQDDFKRLVAYSSVSHMGFVLIGVFAFNAYAFQGAVIQMIAHGISTGALFMVAGMIQERLHTRDMHRMGGLWQRMPQLGAMALFFAVASLGMPGLGNFVGEILVLLGAFQSDITVTVAAAIGLVGASVYSLVLIQRSFQGARFAGAQSLRDLNGREGVAMGLLAVLILALGVYPQPVMSIAEPGLDHLLTLLNGAVADGGMP